ncbi:MAG: sulfatase/phosphatase domain-containing protein, partial [Algoriphagus sp.]
TEHLWQVDIIAPSEAIRTEQWKYFRYINDPSHEELYDLRADPLETNNLAKDPAHQATLKKLREKMEKKIVEYLKDRVE